MKLKDLLLKVHSKEQAMKIVRYVGNDKKRFAELMKLFFTGENRVRQVAGWPMSYSAMAHPELVMPYLKPLLENLKRKGLHDAEKRNTVRLMQNLDLPENLQGLAAEVMFPLISSPDEAVAVKCFAMTALARICKTHPELGRELKMVLEEQLPYASSGVKARTKRTLKDLNLA